MPRGVAMRSTIEGGPEGLAIVIPAYRNLFVLCFLGVWLVGWLLGAATVIAQIAAAGRAPQDAFLFLWLLFWAVGGCFAAYGWLWMLAGKERLLLGTSTLRMKREILGLGWTESFELRKIRNLRVAPQPIGPRDPGAVFRPLGARGGMIVFQYEGRTVRFGGAIDAAEAQTIVDRMRQRFAFPETPPLA